MRARSWLLVKGLKQDGRHWRDLPARLAERVPGRVLTLDLPGAGNARGRDVPSTISAYVDDVAARFEAEATPGDGPWGMVGLSLAGMVAMHWLARRPGQLATAIVGNSSLAGLCPPTWRIRPSALPVLARAAASRDVETIEALTLSLSSSALEDAARARALAEHVAWQRAVPFTRRAFVRQTRVGATARMPERRDLPVLIAQGTADKLVDPRCSERLAQAFGAPLLRCEGAGHDLSLDAPDWLIDAIVFWGAGEPGE